MSPHSWPVVFLLVAGARRTGGASWLNYDTTRRDIRQSSCPAVAIPAVAIGRGRRGGYWEPLGATQAHVHGVTPLAGLEAADVVAAGAGADAAPARGLKGGHGEDAGNADGAVSITRGAHYGAGGGT